MLSNTHLTNGMHCCMSAATCARQSNISSSLKQINIIFWISANCHVIVLWKCYRLVLLEISFTSLQATLIPQLIAPQHQYITLDELLQKGEKIKIQNVKVMQQYTSVSASLPACLIPKQAVHPSLSVRWQACRYPCIVTFITPHPRFSLLPLCTALHQSYYSPSTVCSSYVCHYLCLSCTIM